MEGEVQTNRQKEPGHNKTYYHSYVCSYLSNIAVSQSMVRYNEIAEGCCFVTAQYFTIHEQ